MSVTAPSHELARRGRAHTRLRELLDARGPASLHRHEREVIVDAADALLFDEPDAAERRDRAVELLDELVEAERWEPHAAAAAVSALRACGPALPAATAWV
jgi:hypothetical protein